MAKLSFAEVLGWQQLGQGVCGGRERAAVTIPLHQLLCFCDSWNRKGMTCICIRMTRKLLLKYLVIFAFHTYSSFAVLLLFLLVFLNTVRVQYCGYLSYLYSRESWLPLFFNSKNVWEWMIFDKCLGNRNRTFRLVSRLGILDKIA